MNKIKQNKQVIEKKDESLRIHANKTFTIPVNGKVLHSKCFMFTITYIYISI